MTNSGAKPITEHEGKKYLRAIRAADSDVVINVDVYAVLEAFGVTCPARTHAIKKLLCCGTRGKGDAIADLNGVLAAVSRAVQLEEKRGLQYSFAAATGNPFDLTVNGQSVAGGSKYETNAAIKVKVEGTTSHSVDSGLMEEVVRRARKEVEKQIKEDEATLLQGDGSKPPEGVMQAATGEVAYSDEAAIKIYDSTLRHIDETLKKGGVVYGSFNGEKVTIRAKSSYDGNGTIPLQMSPIVTGGSGSNGASMSSGTMSGEEKKRFSESLQVSGSKALSPHWESVPDSDNTDKEGFWRVRWSQPSEDGKYYWVGHYGYDYGLHSDWCKHASERNAESLNRSGKLPGDFKAFQSLRTEPECVVPGTTVEFNFGP